MKPMQVQVCGYTTHTRSAVVLEESPCPRGPIYKSLSLSSDLKSLSLRTNLQVLVLVLRRKVLVLGHQVLVLEDQFTSPCTCPRTSSPCPCPRAISPWLQHCTQSNLRSVREVQRRWQGSDTWRQVDQEPSWNQTLAYRTTRRSMTGSSLHSTHGRKEIYTVNRKKRATLFFIITYGFFGSIFILFVPVETGRNTLHQSIK